MSPGACALPCGPPGRPSRWPGARLGRRARAGDVITASAQRDAVYVSTFPARRLRQGQPPLFAHNLARALDTYVRRACRSVHVSGHSMGGTVALRTPHLSEPRDPLVLVDVAACCIARCSRVPARVAAQRASAGFAVFESVRRSSAAENGRCGTGLGAPAFARYASRLSSASPLCDVEHISCILWRRRRPTLIIWARDTSRRWHRPAWPRRFPAPPHLLEGAATPAGAVPTVSTRF